MKLRTSLPFRATKESERQITGEKSLFLSRFFLFNSLLLATFYGSADIYMYVISTLRTQAKQIFRQTWKRPALKVLVTSAAQGIPSGKASVLPAMAFFARSSPNLRQGTKWCSQQCESVRTELTWSKTTWRNKISWVSREWNLPLRSVKVQCILQG